MSAPLITYPPELPVSAARDEIAAAIRDHQVVVVAGATGSGKTTQLPKICLELGRTSIAHTQPRRLAARTIAERIAEELHVPLGGLVGYKVRFTDQVSDQTQIALMTDGILLNEIHRDRLLRRYDTIIIDEAHERSLNIDFLMGYLVRTLPERPDLKVIITSATIDPESFARHFALGGDPAPVVEVSGRTYPVEIRYRGVDEDTEDDVDAIVSALKELEREPAGDVLVFLPGEAEIRDAADAVRGAYKSTSAPVEVLPLFGRLSAAEQHRVFEPSKVAGLRRRVVLATNVAETSLTVPGIKYVVDTGTARISRYSTRSKVQRLPIEAISQASAQQRSGRAGRTSDGIAIRLYGEEDFDGRPEFTDPEILRTNLASVVLQMLSLGFGDIAAFPFLTPPDSRNIKAALDLLAELGAVRDGRDGPELTRIGRDLSRLPIEPRFARMLLEAARTGVLDDVLAIVAGLTIQDVRERPEERREAATAAHARYTDPTSDFLTLLNLWQHLNERRDALGSSAFRRLCRDEFLNYVRVREWFDVHRQLRSLTRDIARRTKGAAEPPKPVRAKEPKPEGSLDLPGAADPDAVHRAILSGLLSQIGVLDERSVPKQTGTTKPKGRPIAQYRGARGITFSIFPGSGLKKKSPQAVMAAELVETSRLFARTVAAIDPAWAESLAGDLVNRSISEPHWSKQSGAAMAYEKVTLFGVEIIPRRRVQFARIDRAGSREMFVRHALVEGEWDPSKLPQNVTAFLRQNHELRRRLEKQEERERRRDILAGDEAVFAFYDARIPADVFDIRSFEKWWRTQLETTPKLLTMRESDLLDGAAASDRDAYPAQWPQADQTLGLAYRFEPGARDDGVTVVIPLPLLAGLRPDGFDWQVPGARDELITAMLRALPKAIRRNVVPAADWATKFAAEIAGDGPENHAGLPSETLAQALAKRIQRVANQPVTADAFELERVPAHLTMNFRAVDGRGRALDSDRDLGALQKRLSERARDSVASSLQRSAPQNVAAAPVRTIERTGITEWDFDELPAQVDTKVAGGVVRGYPALTDDGDAVSIRMLTDADEADRVTRHGVRRLVLLHVPSPVSYVQDHLTAKEKLSLAASPYSGVRALIEDCRVAVADAVIARTVPHTIRTRADFERARDAVSSAVIEETFRTVGLVSRILDLHREATKGLKSATAMQLLAALTDMRGQLDGLVFSGFVSTTGLDRLAHLPRYLEGVKVRTAGLLENAGRDRTWLSEYERARTLYDDAGGTIPIAPDAPLVHVRWLLEEFRISLFAQRLGTAEPVSMQRITKALRGS
ncbi:ATP-dependent RNA helicase HrpA [Microbacterium gorillae]